ncbi:hypothetical protein L2089_07225 [Paenibacillus hunanensis]|uniref:hypothetical protein n=1 Tax=Paenibacillus hunanensis TaxID=539262 RepID=UPI002027582D|nr:hypothetical protein [Paenibacillus hunanensis]MCL9660472.1 hypothetical protein [Paenibacillus hunanensis]
MFSKIELILNISLFPIQDLTFLGQSKITEVLDHTFYNQISKSNRRAKKNMLYTEIYNHILRKSKPKSLDEIQLLLQKFYPMLHEDSYLPKMHTEWHLYDHYFQILGEFADSLLSYRDGDIIFKYWKNDANNYKKWRFVDFMESYKGQDKVHFFHSLSRFMPLDLFIAVHHSRNNIQHPIQLHEFYQHINLADASLDDILQRGVAENHIHASAAFNFSILWQMVMNDHSPDEYLKRFKTNHLATSDEVENYILTARILRMILTLFLKEQRQMNADCSIAYNGCKQTLYDWIEDTFYESRIDYVQSLPIHEQILKIIREPERKFLNVDQLKDIIERLQVHIIPFTSKDSPDFVTTVFNEHSSIKTYGENLLLQFSMRYKQDLCHRTTYFQHLEQFFRAFFKYISIKNEFYQQVTQPTVLHGLDFFRGYFDRATDGIMKDRQYYKTMLRTLFQNRYLRKVELRISIKNKLDQNKKTLQEILKSYQEVLIEDYMVLDDPNVEFPLLGIVYHLIKKPDDLKKDISLYDDQRSHTMKQSLHFGELQEEYILQIQHLQDLRLRVPMATNFIVGLDAASLENNTPVQVFAPVFEEARDSQYDGLRISDPEGNILPRQSLFFTFHAGEDFRHLSSGLRRMDEVVTYCKLHSGDRIGHGIALGVDIDKWINDNPIVILPRGEYLDNLLWIWGVYSTTAKIQTETLVYLERRIEAIAAEIFLEESLIEAAHLRASILYNTYKRRFKRIKNEALAILKYNNEDNKTKKVEDCLYESYHSQSTLKKMNDPIYVTNNQIEKMMLVDMQNYLVHKISVAGIVIEVNPSSNEAIGEIDSVFGNQLFRLQSANNVDLTNVLVNINSDDPMIFNTNVSNELVYIYYGMLQQGISRETALEWIDKLRQSGMNTSFIRNGRSRKQYLDILGVTIRSLEDPSYS